jgi:hypothetical protein
VATRVHYLLAFYVILGGRKGPEIYVPELLSFLPTAHHSTIVPH